MERAVDLLRLEECRVNSTIKFKSSATELNTKKENRCTVNKFISESRVIGGRADSR